MTTHPPIVACVVAIAIAVSIPPPARGEVIVVEVGKNTGAEADFQRAKASSADANTAFADGDITSALAHAEAAYSAYSNASTALQMATIYAKTDAHRKAFKWFLVARNHKLAEAFVGRVDEGLKTHGAKARLGVLRLQTTPAAATVEVDDGAGHTLGGVYFGLSFGAHEIVVSAPGFSPLTLEVVVSDAATQTLDTRLEPAPATQASIALPLGLIIGGLVVAGAGAGLHAWGLGADREVRSNNLSWEARGVSLESARAEYDSHKSDASAGTTAAFVLYGVGAAAIVAGALIWALGTEERSAEGTVGLTVAPTVIPQGGAVILGGTF